MDVNKILNSILTYGKYFLSGVGIGLALYYAKFTMPFIEWLKGGIEDQDGQLANKDLQITFVSLLIGFIVVSSYFGASYTDSIIWGGWATLGGLYGIKEIYGKKDGN